MLQSMYVLVRNKYFKSLSNGVHRWEGQKQLLFLTGHWAFTWSHCDYICTVHQNRNRKGWSLWMLAHEHCCLVYLAFGTGPLLHPLHRGDSSQELSVRPQLMQLLLIAWQLTGGVGARTHSTRRQVHKYVSICTHIHMYTCLSVISTHKATTACPCNYTQQTCD